MIAINTMIKMERLIKCFPEDFNWGNEVVKIDDITNAIENRQIEETESFKPNIPMPYVWHIGRIIYFINHPEEIIFIDIENVNDGYYLLPTPLIIDGYHRIFAAKWLFLHNKIKEVYCTYKGRKDILYYLTGKSNKIPSGWIEKSNDIEIRNFCITNKSNEFYYTYDKDKIFFTDDVKKAFKLTESAAKDLIDMFNEVFPGDSYNIFEEAIVNMAE